MQYLYNMDIVICETAGFCYGVRRAFDMAKNFLQSHTDACFYKDFIHNRSAVLRSFKQIPVAQKLDQIDGRSAVLRAHGECVGTYDYLSRNKVEYVDCICPNVLAIRRLIMSKADDGYRICIIGKLEHPEVIGLKSFVQDCIVLDHKRDLSLDSVKKLFVVVQTTFGSDRAKEISDYLSMQCKSKGIAYEYRDTCCTHQKDNISKSIALCKTCNYAVVYGDRSSSNTVELYESVRSVTPTIFVSSTKELTDKLGLFENLSCVKLALLAGASADPMELIDIKHFLLKYTNN